MIFVPDDCQLKRMLNYYQLDLSVLMELLAAQTTLYTRMVTVGYKDEDLKACQKIIEDLQFEIESRMGNLGNTTVSDININFSE
jgi:hypothetical protein